MLCPHSPTSLQGVFVIAMLPALTRGYTMVPTWGHAATYISSPPAILIQGGKTSIFSDVYSSAPNTDAAIYLPLSSNFSTSSPPYTLLSPTSAPTYAWHCIAPISNLEGLVFGGDGGTSEPMQTLADSAWLFQLDSTTSTTSINFTHQSTGWASQPTRRIHQTCAGPLEGGSTFICGGEKDDGSGETYSNCYMFAVATTTFNVLPSLPLGLFHHSSVYLTNGTLVVVGGAYLSSSTGTATLLPLSTIFVLDTSSTSATWVQVNIGGTIPTPRRGATASLNKSGMGLLLYGGADIGLDTAYADGWVLDLNSLVWSQVITSGPSARFDHIAVTVGNQIVIYGGYGSSTPADNGLYIYDTNLNSFVGYFDSNAASSAVASIAVQQSPLGTATIATKSIETSPITGSQSLITSATSITASEKKGTPNPISTSGTQSSSPSSSAALAYTTSNTGALSTSAKIGLITGLVGSASVAILAMLWMCRRQRLRKRQKGPYAYSPNRGGPRPYGSREKGGPGLLDPQAGNGAQTRKNQQAALGFGSISAGLAGIASSIKDRVGSGSRDAYAQLAEDGGRIPTRWPTRREGLGIRLVGAHQSTKNSIHPHLGTATLVGDQGDTVTDISGDRQYRPRRPAVQGSRFHMLQDEDDDEADEWASGDGNDLGAHWVSTNGILAGVSGRERTSGYTDVSHLATSEPKHQLLDPQNVRILGGPVPTPRASGDLNPFDEAIATATAIDARGGGGTANSAHRYTLPAFSPSDPLDLTSLLIPPVGETQSYSDTSLPRSSRSGQTTVSDPSDAVISHASIAHQASASLLNSIEVVGASLIGHGTISDGDDGGQEGMQEAISPSSPGLSAFASPNTAEDYTPIKRSESFLQRMTGNLRFGRGRSGSITYGIQGRSQGKSGGGEGGRQPSSPTRAHMFDLRDPAPQPTLWPVRSTEDVLQTSTVTSPTSGIGSNERRNTLGHLQEVSAESHASLTSVQSARTMRDMVVVVREPTDNSLETPVVVEDTPPWDSAGEDAGSLLIAEEGECGLGDMRKDRDGGEERVEETLFTAELVVFDGSAFKLSPPRHSVSPFNSSGTLSSTTKPHQSVTPPRPMSEPPIIASIHVPTSITAKTPSSSSISNSTTTIDTPLFGRASVRVSTSNTSTPKTSTRRISTQAQPPSSSPVPSPLVSHRRPVKDVVESINRRSALASLATTPVSSSASSTSGGGGRVNVLSPAAAAPAKARPLSDLFSPVSQYTASPSDMATPILTRNDDVGGSGVGMSTSKQRPRTMYEAVKRTPLTVANPDKKRSGSDDS